MLSMPGEVGLIILILQSSHTEYVTNLSFVNLICLVKTPCLYL